MKWYGAWIQSADEFTNDLARVVNCVTLPHEREAQFEMASHCGKRSFFHLAALNFSNLERILRKLLLKNILTVSEYVTESYAKEKCAGYVKIIS